MARSGTPVGHVDHEHLGGGLEQLGGQMGRGAIAGRTVGEAAGLGARLRQKVGRRPDRTVRPDHRHIGRMPEHSDRGQSCLGGVRQFGVQARHDGHRAGVEQQRETFGRALGHEVIAHHGAGTGLVVHDDRLPPHLGQAVGQGTGHGVGAAAGGKGPTRRTGLAGKLAVFCASADTDTQTRPAARIS